MKNGLDKILKGKITIVGIGNTMRGDDALGPRFVERIKENKKISCVDAGSTPENYVSAIVKDSPDTILFVDAADLGLSPGSYEILSCDEIAKSGLGTHDMSPGVFIDYLKNRTTASIYLLGVQPKSIELGEEMTDCIKNTLTVLKDKIEEVINA